MYSKMQGVQTASATHWCEVKTPPFFFVKAPPSFPLPFGPEREGDAAENAELGEPAVGVEGATAGEEEPEVEAAAGAGGPEPRAAVRCCAASSELTTSSSPGRTSRTRSKPRGPKAQSSEATHQSELPSAFSRALFFFRVRFFLRGKKRVSFFPSFPGLSILLLFPQKKRMGALQKKTLDAAHPSTSGLIPCGSLNATSPTPFTRATHE